jgi:hypothetical protein
MKLYHIAIKQGGSLKQNYQKLKCSTRPQADRNLIKTKFTEKKGRFP